MFLNVFKSTRKRFGLVWTELPSTTSHNSKIKSLMYAEKVLLSD